MYYLPTLVIRLYKHIRNSSKLIDDVNEGSKLLPSRDLNY